ncbi:hypothetical protein [Clostridium saccharobutylicum]|uniref:Uncharacterized protein n=1 Tax=Clostridium saccharobutylicum DSM 13864 TaxID=1345695 RepID=U5MWE0_CLOSA|nr:hypothetical protein [Clostridium saccharobutylicum]AGX43931.1 hypothetical protein CLSA_c29640 [Clostridium saccharobutylicum DSM 13864]AQR91228.1 hypothetical protein CLOSC_29520 [Clostridium saccharobutylicum]AQS01132.1 hypothetical protein CSACC_29590 [Clostridium saccharobutylicum]AQS15115.1 hypothetical protein CLOSACC_29590 [Clostridium saccharobutylicum]MBA2905241.1 hypothetical protein [Clostridium saccharobutylicum]
MTLEQWIEIAEVLITWGFWFIIYGAIAMSLGFGILAIVNKPIRFFR